MRVDYLVRVVGLPADLQVASEDSASALYGTWKVYQMLIDSGLLWRVWYIDEYGQLWVEVNFVNAEGEPEFHTIAIDEGTYERVEFDSYEVLDRLE